MNIRAHCLLTLVGLGLSVLDARVAAAAPDFERALALPKRVENKVTRLKVEPHWLPDGKSFWYRVQVGPSQHEFVWIDAENGARKTAADLKLLGVPGDEARKTSQMKIELRPTWRTGVESGVKFSNQSGREVELFWIDRAGKRIRYGTVAGGAERWQHSFEGHVWLVATPDGEPLAAVEVGAVEQTIVIDGRGSDPEPPKENADQQTHLSPDGKWAAFLEQGVMMLRDVRTNRVHASPPGAEGTARYRGEPQWAPDSSAFVIHIAEPTPKRRVGFVESTPPGQVQPKLIEFDYAKPGDPLPKPIPVLFSVSEKGLERHVVNPTLFSNPFTLADFFDVRWTPDSREFFFDYNQRGHQLYRVLAVNAKTRTVRTVVEETSRTFIDYTQKTWRHWLHETGELLWMSERDGWCHLWLYDAKAGTVKNQVTRGSWPVRDVLHVDEARRQVWFLASGLIDAEDPYQRHLCRANFDGTGFRQLTAGDGDHTVSFSPDRRFFVDTWSRADQPPIHELRRAADGSLVCELERADASALLAARWTMPERFVAKGRDGKTDIHGILIKPAEFDPTKKYPVVEEIYAGPHSAFAPKEFSTLLRQQQLAELGFIVVQMDGMGTNHRGKAFHDVCWKNLKDAGFPDRIAWLREAARTRPWMDLDRVGIYGGSAGGQSAMRALLDHGDFYKVAVADCGCHDNRMDKVWWNEQWLGWPVGEAYVRNSNVVDAHKLRGHLLLIVGELDRNVDPASTMQVVGALQKAGKCFEFLPVIGVGHGAAESPYARRRRMEFLAEHLLGEPSVSSSADPYSVEQMAGWNVHVSAKLIEQDRASVERARTLLRAQLEGIVRVVPAPAVAELRKVPLYVSPEYPNERPRAEYHQAAAWLRANGRDPRMEKSVEFTNVRIFDAEVRRMPVFVLHELAHAYHDRVLGNGHAGIKAAFEKVKAAGKYERVERQDSEGRKHLDRAYALSNPQEYFAECTEAFFGHNDFFPYTREQLKTHDPEMLALLEQLWNLPVHPSAQ